jgi:uncharacterized protein
MSTAIPTKRRLVECDFRRFVRTPSRPLYPRRVSLINETYAIIDTAAYSRLEEVFDPNVVYERPGFDSIFGLVALREFYFTLRDVSTGTHELFEFFECERGVATYGEFHGRSKKGRKLHEQFVDVFLFGRDLVVARKTFFFRKGI